MTRRYHDDANDLDEHGVLRDGRSLRTPMWAMDSLQKGIADHAQNVQPRRITSADASTLGLHKPGWRIETGGNVRDQLVRDGAALDRAELYRLYDEAKAREYLTPTGTGEREFVGTHGGDTCTIDGFRGHLRRDEDGKLKCFADARGDSTVRDERQAAYQEYQDRIQNAWRDWR
jgi:hypothetical protein